MWPATIPSPEMELQAGLRGSREGKGTWVQLAQESQPVWGSRQTGAASDMGGGPTPSPDCRVGVSAHKADPRAWEDGTRAVPASRTKAHRDYTHFGSWQRKPVETGRHSLGDSLLQVGVRGRKRKGVPQPGGTGRRRNAAPPGTLPHSGLQAGMPRPPSARGVPAAPPPRRPHPARSQELAGRAAGAGSEGCGPATAPSRAAGSPRARRGCSQAAHPSPTPGPRPTTRAPGALTAFMAEAMSS